jgi:hypothetical protein
MLTISILFNVVLVIGLAITASRAKARIREEKMATFAGTVGAVTNSIATESKPDQIDRFALALSSIRGNWLATDEIKWRIARAGLLSAYRPPAAADVLGEHGRLLMLQCVRQSPESDALGDAMCEEFSNPKELSELHGDAKLAQAQYALEAQLLAAYSASFNEATTRIFQGR